MPTHRWDCISSQVLNNDKLICLLTSTRSDMKVNLALASNTVPHLWPSDLKLLTERILGKTKKVCKLLMAYSKGLFNLHSHLIKILILVLTTSLENRLISSYTWAEIFPKIIIIISQCRYCVRSYLCDCRSFWHTHECAIDFTSNHWCRISVMNGMRVKADATTASFDFIVEGEKAVIRLKR